MNFASIIYNMKTMFDNPKIRDGFIEYRGDKDSDDVVYLTDNFTVQEMFCKCANKDCNNVHIKLGHLRNLEFFRAKLKRMFKMSVPLHVLSGNRCRSHNDTIGGAKKSQHLVQNGTATDIGFSNIKITKDIVKLAKEIFDGVGWYKKKRFLHLDSRGTKAYWEKE